MFELLDDSHDEAVIKVIGVGGGGGNAVDHMVSETIEGVEFIVLIRMHKHYVIQQLDLLFKSVTQLQKA